MLKPKSISKEERSKVESLLESHKLCFNDLNESGVYLFAAEAKDDTVGYYGYELHGQDALFRSLLVNEEHRGQGFGSEIMKLAIETLKNEQVEDVYLLTNTAPDFFTKHGFEIVNRADVPEAIGKTVEFKDFCPDDSVCMHLKLKQ